MAGQIDRVTEAARNRSPFGRGVMTHEVRGATQRAARTRNDEEQDRGSGWRGDNPLVEWNGPKRHGRNGRNDG